MTHSRWRLSEAAPFDRWSQTQFGPAARFARATTTIASDVLLVLLVIPRGQFPESSANAQAHWRNTHQNWGQTPERVALGARALLALRFPGEVRNGTKFRTTMPLFFTARDKPKSNHQGARTSQVNASLPTNDTQSLCRNIDFARPPL